MAHVRESRGPKGNQLDAVGLAEMLRVGAVMRISGHKTRSVFERYNIVSDDDVSQAVKVIEAGQRAEKRKAKRAGVGKDLVKRVESAS